MDELDESAVAVAIPSGSTSLDSIPLAVNMYFVFLRPAGTAPRPAIVPPIKDLTITFLLGHGNELTSISNLVIYGVKEFACKNLLFWL